MADQTLLLDIIQACREFRQRQLWQRFSNSDCFSVRLPEMKDPVLASVMGAGGEQFGLLLFCGQHAAAAFSALTTGAGPEDEDADIANLLGYSLVEFGSLSDDDQSFFRAAGVYPRHDESVPDFLVKPAHRGPRLPNRDDLILLLRVLKGLVAADRRKLLKSGGLDRDEGVCSVTLEGDPMHPRVTATRERGLRRSVPSPTIGAPRLPDLRGLPRLETTWLVGTPRLGRTIETDDRSVRLLLIIDDDNDLILYASPIVTEKIEEAVDQLVATFRGHPADGSVGLPRRIVFASRRLYERLDPALRELGVKCTYRPDVAKLRAVFLDFQQFLDQGDPAHAESSERATDPEDEVPAPDDLVGWKQADRRLSQRFGAAVRDGKVIRSPRVVRRYFDDDDLDGFLSRHAQRSVTMAYVSWCVLDCRPQKSSPTLAETMLAEGLPLAEATLLDARRKAFPSLYRVAGHDPASGTVELEDVVIGGAVTVHDQLLSENIQDSICLVLRVFPAGQFHFIELAGPPLGVGMSLDAIDFLRDCGLQFTPAGLKRGSHKLGWLWGWIDAWEANARPPKLLNTDGDPLLFHTASFAVADAHEVRRALVDRADVDYDQEEDEYMWFRKPEKGAEILGERVSLGTIQFVENELVLSVNSKKRFETARRWLMTLPGVTFGNFVTQNVDSLRATHPTEHGTAAAKPEITHELAAALQEMLDRQYMEWIDTPLPVLGGKTPRQACQTRTGRERVAILIRTAPDPVGPVPIRIPRRKLLRELGLEG